MRANESSHNYAYAKNSHGQRLLFYIWEGQYLAVLVVYYHSFDNEILERIDISVPLPPALCLCSLFETYYSF